MNPASVPIRNPMPDNDANLVSDTADEAEGLYDRIDELLAEIDEACEITSDGFDPDEVDAQLPSLSDKGELAEIPDLELENPDLDLDGDFEGDSPDDPLSEIEAETPSESPDAEPLAKPANEPADELAEAADTEPEAATDDEPSQDDDLLAAINEELAHLDDSPEPTEDEATAEEPVAEATEPQPEPSPMDRPEPPEEVNPEDVSVEFGLEDLDDMVAELDDQKAPERSVQPKGDPKAEPEAAPKPVAKSESKPSPEPASEPEPEPAPVAAPAPKPAAAPAKPIPKPKRDFAPALAVAYRAGAVTLSPIAKVLDTQPRMLRDSIGWVGAITVFYAVCLWTYALLFRGTSVPEQSPQGVTIIGETAAGNAATGN